MSGRPTYTTREVVAGCRDCHGREAQWRGPNAQGVAARHHDAHQHQTWVEVTLKIVYGNGPDPEVVPQLAFDDALA